MKDWLDRSPSIRKEYRIKEGRGDFLHGSTTNGTTELKMSCFGGGWRGESLDKTEAEDGGQMAHREQKE